MLQRRSWLKSQQSKHEETMETVTEFIFMGSKSLNRVSEAMQLKDTCSLEEKTEQT